MKLGTAVDSLNKFVASPRLKRRRGAEPIHEPWRLEAKAAGQGRTVMAQAAGRHGGSSDRVSKREWR